MEINLLSGALGAEVRDINLKDSSDKIEFMASDADLDGLLALLRD